MGASIIIGVPGHWPSRREVVTSIAERSGGFLFAGMVLMEIATKKAFQLAIYEKDAHLAKAFEIAGQGTFSPDQLRRIESHTYTLYALSNDVSNEACRDMLRVGKALIQSGGCAVKVDSAGLAHTSETWKQWAESENLFDVYRAFVILVGAAEQYYSCGMHNFGLEDTTVGRELPPDEAADLMNCFNHWRLSENPAVKDGETFSVSCDAPHYRLRKRRCEWFEEKDSFHNPFGIWHLEPVRISGK